VVAEGNSVRLIDRREISDICHKDSGFHYVDQAGTVLGQKAGEVGNGLCRLRSNPARYDGPVPRAQLAGHDQPRPSRDNRRVRAYRRGGHVVGG
jgi:hypothetical protein